MTRCTILLPHVASIWICGMQPGPSYLLEDPQVLLSVNFESHLKKMQGHLLAMTCNHPKGHDALRVLGPHDWGSLCLPWTHPPAIPSVVGLVHSEELLV